MPTPCPQSAHSCIYLNDLAVMCLRRHSGFRPPDQGRKYMFVMYGGSAKTDTKGEYLQYPYSILVKVDESDRKALEQDTRFFFPAYMGPFGLARAGLHGAQEGRLGRGARARRRVVPVGRAEETDQAARRSLTPVSAKPWFDRRAMSFASPFPEVEIPSTSVYDFLFADIDDADARPGRAGRREVRAGRPATAR